VPLLDFECAQGHRFEMWVPLVEINVELTMLDAEVTRTCPECGGLGKQIFPKAPGMHTSSGASAAADEATYRKHNVTRKTISGDGFGGTIEGAPISHVDGCGCPACKRTIRRSAVTVAAEPGREH